MRSKNMKYIPKHNLDRKNLKIKLRYKHKIYDMSAFFKKSCEKNLFQVFQDILFQNSVMKLKHMHIWRTKANKMNVYITVIPLTSLNLKLSIKL